jgi:hypothetical protein
VIAPESSVRGGFAEERSRFGLFSLLEAFPASGGETADNPCAKTFSNIFLFLFFLKT